MVGVQPCVAGWAGSIQFAAVSIPGIDSSTFLGRKEGGRAMLGHVRDEGLDEGLDEGRKEDGLDEGLDEACPE